MLDYAVNEIWNLDCPITGILAGTETAHSAQPDAYAPFLTNGKLLAYLFSPFHNRDLWSFHDPAQGHNLYWELFSGTAEGGLLGFYPDENGSPSAACGKITPTPLVWARFVGGCSTSPVIFSKPNGDLVSSCPSVDGRLCADVFGRTAGKPPFLGGMGGTFRRCTHRITGRCCIMRSAHISCWK